MEGLVASMSLSSSSGTQFPEDLPSVFGARINFRLRVQGDWESVQSYIEALRSLAVSCKYTSKEIMEETIKDQFIFGLKSKAIQEKICWEMDENLSLNDAIAIATAGEAFQIMRFKKQRPLENEEIFDVLGRYLEVHTLLTMYLVSKPCQNLVKKQVGTLLGKVPVGVPDGIAKASWAYSARMGDGLNFSSSREIREFIGKVANGERYAAWSTIGEGIVGFYIKPRPDPTCHFSCSAYLESYFDTIDDRDGCSEGSNDVIYETVVRFLQIFGELVKVLIWGDDNFPMTLNEMKGMLRYTPNLRKLNVGTILVGKRNLEQVAPWPKLPYLNSLYCQYSDTLSYNSWVKNLLRAYGPQFTTLGLQSPLRIRTPDQTYLMYLRNVQHLAFSGEMKFLRQLGQCEHAEWNLKKLSVTFDLSNDCFRKHFDDFDVSDGKLNLWGLINQNSSTLEEVYLEFPHYFEIFLKTFLLPAIHNPVDSATNCSKVKKLVISANCLIRAMETLQVLCKNFPNLEQIYFTDWRDGLADEYHKFMDHEWEHSSGMSELKKKILFEEGDYKVPLPWDPLSEEGLAHFWNGLNSLKKIIVLKNCQHSPVVLQKYRD